MENIGTALKDRGKIVVLIVLKWLFFIRSVLEVLNFVWAFVLDCAVVTAPDL